MRSFAPKWGTPLRSEGSEGGEEKSINNQLGYKLRGIYAEKDYQVPVNMFFFHSRGIKNSIQKKVYRPPSLK
ncbi:MAG: hypothetical protein ACMUEL_09565 [Flavobacteriales bacterium Tduv]